MAERFDIAIIGGGIAGMSLAAAIGSRATTVLLEAEPQLFHHTSSRSAQQMQPTYGPDPVRRLTTASIPLVGEIAATLPAPIFTPRPLLWVDYAEDRTEFEHVLATVPGVRDIGAAEAIRLLPALRADLLRSAAIDDVAVEVDVPQLLDAYLRQAVSTGTVVRSASRVTGLQRVGDAWTIEAGADRIEAGIVVDAAGAWAERVAALAGVQARGLTPKRRTVVVAPATGRPVDPLWPMASDVADRFYFRPSGSEILASSLEDVPSDPEDAQPNAETVRTTIDRVDAATDLELGMPTRTWTGLRTLSRDTSPIVGFDPDVPGFFWLAGQGGYGIQTSAGLARVAASELLGIAHGLDGLDGVLDDLSPARFATIG
jgi:D-arginine dehydrogenase